MDRVDDFLRHYVEQPYDPVKAHEYYIKNRDLKGRATSGMSQVQKEAWNYSKDRVSTDKKLQVESAKVANDKKIEAFQKSADETRARISEKLRLFIEKITKDTASQKISISDKAKSDISNVAPIPYGVTGQQRVILIQKRNKEIADIRNKANSSIGNLSIDTKSSQQQVNATASSERDKARTDLKNIINTTREAYTKAKATLDANYEAIYAKEYGKVLTTVAGKAAKVKAKAKPKALPKEKTGGIIYYTPAEMNANKNN